MNQWKTILIGLLFCLSIETYAQEKYSKVEIPVSSERIQKFLFDSLELDHYSFENGAMTVVLSQAEIARLRNGGILHQILVEDMVQHTLEVNSRTTPTDVTRAGFQESCKQVTAMINTPVSFGTGGSLRLGAAVGNPGYFTYSEMQAKMLELATNYPSIVTRFSIGNSYQGNPIYAVKISDNVGTDEAEPEVLYTGLQHAREAIGGTSLIFFMQFLAENYSTKQNIKELVDSREIFIIPCVNPDGYIYNYTSPNPTTGGGLWRKSRRPTTAGNYGVDLNRNYSVDWSNCTGASSSCGSSSPSSDTYYGTAAFSEPETQAVRNFVITRNFVVAIDQHCHGSYYSLPYGRPTLHPPFNNEDAAFYSHIPSLMGLHNGHRAGNSPETVNYEVAGGIKDWLLMGDIGTGNKGKIYGMTGEAGGGEFWAPVAQIPQLCKELCFQNLQLALAAGAYYDIQDVSDLALPASLTGRLGFTVRRIGLTSGNATVSILPLENIASVGAPVVVSSLANYYESFTDSITYTLPSAITAGQRIRFAWKVEAGGVVVYDTVVKFYNPTIIMTDDMEGTFSTRWSSSTGWDFVSGTAYKGSKSMTESPSGNYTSNSTRTATYNASFNLSDASAAYLSFWVKHRSENFRDKLQVQVSTNSTNGTNGTWTAVCGRNTVAETNTTNGGTLGGQPALTGIRETWTRELFDLSVYKGNANVRFRFQFTSDGDAGSFAYELDDGFYIDNVQLIKSTATLVLLPVQFLSFNAKVLTNKSVELNWEASIDDQHGHFEIERSIAGNPFQTIGRINNGPLRFIDENAATGSNYYRIKQVDKNGDRSYSKTLHVIIRSQFNVTLFPNPIKDDYLTIKIDSKERKMIRIQIVDITGKAFYNETRTMDATVTEIKIDASAWKPQTYILKISDGSGESLLYQKILKQ